MEKKSPPLNHEELLQLKWLLGGVLTLLAAWTAFYLDVEGWPVAVTSLGVAVGLVRPALLARIPRLVHKLAFPAIVAIFAGDLWLTGEVLPAVVRLDLVLLLYRGITYRKKRDDLQVIVLGLFLIVVAGVLTVSLAFAVQILLFTGFALGLLLTITLVETGGKKTADETGPDGVPAWARVDWGRLLRRVRAVADWRIVTLGAGLFAGVVVVSGLLFLAIPRFQLENSLFLDRLMAKKARTGFTDTVRFGEVTDIQQDTSVALSVDVSDRAQIPAVPYWRMLVLDEYHEGMFRLSAGLRLKAFTAERTEAAVRGPARPKLGEPVYWTFYLESGVSRYLPLLGAFELLRFREPQNFRYAPQLGIMALRTEPATMLAYRAEGMDGNGATRPDPDFAARWRNRPDDRGPREAQALMVRLMPGQADNDALARMVGEINGGAPQPAGEFARRAVAWLRERHGYSMSPRIPAGAGEALVRWMDSREGGHCELFAGSLVLLARRAGLPARLVVGFKGGTWNAYSNNFTIRNSDAHAWCEIFDATAGAWLRADPTPGVLDNLGPEAKGEAALAGRTDRSWSARFDSLRIFWYRRIVSFDQRSQLETLKAVKEVTTHTGQRLRAALERAVQAAKTWLAGPWDTRRIALTLAALAGAGGLILVVVNFRYVIRALGKGRGRKPDPVRAEAGRWLGKLRVPGAGGWSGEANAVVAELQRLRFGPVETWPEPRAVFRRAGHVAQ
ncbi:MAG: DUF3488 domain-containing protein, partial [Verrucomicrobia bacterium]|nr:DUF3488 domain-containing protein [Verrucomicrobiota bacterium]